jgi:hypothetical protein
MPHHVRPLSRRQLVLSSLLAPALPTTAAAAPPESAAVVLRYFPVGPIYDYRWKLLELVLRRTQRHGEPAPRLEPAGGDASQSRAVLQLEDNALDVLALGVNEERTAELLPVRIDILKGIVGFRIFIIRAEDQPRIAKMGPRALRTNLVYGLNNQWADLPVMKANGFNVQGGTGYDNLFAMLAARRFDAFPRGLNEAYREIELQHANYPALAVERHKALYIPYPVYFWVNQRNTALAQRIRKGLQAAEADGSFRQLFEHYHAQEIATLAREPRQVLRLRNPQLKPVDAVPDTSWWWPRAPQS